MEEIIDLKKNKRENELFYSTSTVDNVQLWMKRYKPKNKKKVSDFPVILCHGLLANKHTLDFGHKENNRKLWDDYSLAAYLHKGGEDKKFCFDVWVPELRGRRSYSEYDFEKRNNKIQNIEWCFDQYIDFDVPAIVKKIHSEYNTDIQIFWVGMSMGGMLAYAYGQTKEGDKNLRGAVTIGSPISFEFNEGREFNLIKTFAPRKIFHHINLRSILENNPRFKEIFICKAINCKNIDRDVIEKYIELGYDNSISSKIVSHFGVFFRHKNFCRYPKYPWLYDFFDKIPIINKVVEPYSWKKNLHKFKRPLLAIAGRADEEAPPEDVKYILNHIGSTDITYLEYSRDSLLTDINYGHLDFHKGKKAKTEFYPKIYDWLKEKSRY
jgi:pimeloyl-ACP methyl ester carboxylesterase